MNRPLHIRLSRSLRAHPPFTPVVLRAWLPIGLSSIVLAVLSAWLGNVQLLVAALVLGSIAGPVAFLVDLQHRTGLAWHPSRAMLLTGALVGGPLAVAAAQLLERGFPALGPNAPTLLIGPIEEATKLAVPALLLLVRRTSQRDALICAVAAAASFQSIENAFVAVGTLGLSSGHGAVTASVGVLAARGVIGPFTHCMWTSTIAISWFGTSRHCGVLADPRTRHLLGWFLVVAALHSVWDVSTGAPQPLALVLSGAAFAGTLLAHHLATRQVARTWARARRAGVGRG